MPGFNPDKLNIHDLTVEEPEKESEPPFDPERDVTEEDWEKIKKGELKAGRMIEPGRPKNWASFTNDFAIYAKILNPKIDFNEDFGMRDVFAKVYKTDFEEYKKEKFQGLDAHGFSRAVEQARILVPELRIEENDNAWRLLEEELKYLGESEIWNQFCRQLAIMKLYNPEHHVNVSEVDLKNIKDTLEKYKNREDWASFSEMASHVKVSGLGLDLNLDRATWRGMKEKLSEYRTRPNSYLYFLWHAAAMNILAAEEVKVTGKGLEINLRKPGLLQSETSLMPEQRNF